MLNNGTTLYNLLKVIYIKISLILNALTNYNFVRKVYFIINCFRIISTKKHDDKPSLNGKIILLQYLRGIIINYYKI